ncbi:hypothetical protein PFICI_00809 [Pestalotiopsis fici W106-1]|uniref:WSC domain-containing protein n=1 Tax=Pestalotiopsis fici (strain W106-1 / CGMCC3.15140) TaxID=1229662 RepID=W3XNX9_PESFW|nr:uncharacterized protein PFICI_00809 [Pestalotiopsis fici W106-1]ETS86981.1 hypothetical protein PFICI_00809 [Pestalotiopsis fici W106-1]
MRFHTVLAALGACLFEPSFAQQYAGDSINSSLPSVPGSEIAYFRIKDPSGANNNLTLINYYSHGKSGKRLVESNVQRAVVIVHGLNRDPGTYMSNMLSALSQVTTDSNINTDSVAIMAPYFPNGDDKNYGYPWTDGLKSGRGSTTNALVWSGSQWSAGGNNQYPYTSKNTSSYAVLDQVIQYFDNTTLFPNMKQIVIAGHSMGGQTVQRYAAIGAQLNTKSPVSYWVANPNSYVWLSTDRPFSTASCAAYDVYREGFTNFSTYPMTYATSLVAQGRSAILANFNSKAVNYARGTKDLGDDSSGCAPGTTGSNRNERFFNFIKAFPPSCPNPTGGNCDTVDFINSGHDGGAMMASSAGLARLFIDNFYGNGNRSYDFGYPRQQDGDDPYPNPSLNGTSSSVNNNTYAGNMTYWGCWSDQTPLTLTNMTYQSDANTIELCTSTCAAGGNTIAGLEYGSQCFCGTSLGYLSQQVIESSCSTACPGNSSEICGGGNRLSLYSNGSPAQQSAPGTPESIGDFYYVSCYTEATSGHALSSKSTSTSSMTLEYCASYCKGYQYFGTEYGSECYCGNSFAAGANRTSDSECSMLCANDTSEYCGAGYRLTVYQNTTWVASSTTADISCPTSNNTVVTSNGKNFTIECGVDHSGGDLTSTTVSSFQGCIDACASNSQCVDVSLSGTSCYLKSTLGAAVSNSGIWGAKLSSGSSTSTSSSTTTSKSSTSSAASTVTTTGTSSLSSVATTTTSSAAATSTAPTCPGSNSTVYTSNGLSFLIECGIDHAGGDLTSLSVSSFAACIDACAQNSQCVDVSLSGSACYLKSTLGASVSNGVWGAKLITSSSTTSSASGSSTTATTTATSSSATTSLSSTVSTTSSTTVTSTSTTTSATASTTSIVCPASNSTTYVTGGLSFVIECGIDHAGGDFKSVSTSNLQQCIDACAAESQCVVVSFQGSACYMKSSVQAPVYNAVQGARLVTSTSSSSSVSSSSLSSTSTSSSSSITSSTLSTVTSISSTSSTSSTSPTSTATTLTTLSTISTTSTTTSSSVISSTTTSSSAAATTTSALSAGFSALGCYVDSGNPRLLTYQATSGSTNTPQSCATACQSAGYKYSGTEYASECWCGNTKPDNSTLATSSSECNMACSGDATQTCGAGNRLSVVDDTTWTSSFGVRASYGTWTLMDCYVDTSSRILPNGVSLSASGGSSNATIAHCLDACAASGYPYCGEEYYSECYGGQLSSSAAVASGADPLSAGCDYPCNGNKTEACGGSNRILVYKNTALV